MSLNFKKKMDGQPNFFWVENLIILTIDARIIIEAVIPLY